MDIRIGPLKKTLGVNTAPCGDQSPRGGRCHQVVTVTTARKNAPAVRHIFTKPRALPRIRPGGGREDQTAPAWHPHWKSRQTGITVGYFIFNDAHMV